MKRRRVIPGNRGRVEPLACLWLVLSLAACESGGTSSNKDGAGGSGGQDAAAEAVIHKDAAPDLGPEAAGPDAPPIEAPPPAMDMCDVLKHDCPSGLVCYVTCPSGTTSCLMDQGGTGKQWDPCTGFNTCAKGYECIGTMSGYMCLKYCQTNPDCNEGGTCYMIATGPACGGRPLPAGACYGTPPPADAGGDGSADAGSSD